MAAPKSRVVRPSVSKRPTGERLRYVETGINNFGNAYLGLDIGDQVGSDGAVSYRVTGKLSGGGWETDYSDDFRGTIAPSLTWMRDEDTSITFLGSYQHIDLTHTSTGFLPYEGTVVDAPGFGRIPHDLFYGEPDFDSYNRNQAMIGYEFEHTFDNDWTVRQNLRYARLSLKEDGLYGSGIDFTDPTKLGAPVHHTVPVREVRLAAGAGFIVAICGDIMTMPGLPKVPSAENIRLDHGQIEGLF